MIAITPTPLPVRYSITAMSPVAAQAAIMAVLPRVKTVITSTRLTAVSLVTPPRPGLPQRGLTMLKLMALVAAVITAPLH